MGGKHQARCEVARDCGGNGIVIASAPGASYRWSGRCHLHTVGLVWILTAWTSRAVRVHLFSSLQCIPLDATSRRAWKHSLERKSPLSRAFSTTYRLRWMYLELNLVPRRGLEPPRLAALVPETSASTNSAIWAGRRIITNGFGLAKPFFASMLELGGGDEGPCGGAAGAISAGMDATSGVITSAITLPSQARKTRIKKAALKSGFLVKLVPRRGLEPPRLAALVPETSASTNSAIWAGRREL